MKSLLRSFLINLVAIFLTSEFIPGLSIEGGINTYIYSALIFMVINILIVPLLKIMFLPLNLLTLGIFSWVVNVLALYILTTIVPNLRLMPYSFSGFSLGGVIIPSFGLSVLYVAILCSFMIGFVVHFLHWLSK